MSFEMKFKGMFNVSNSDLYSLFNQKEKQEH